MFFFRLGVSTLQTSVGNSSFLITGLLTDAIEPTDIVTSTLTHILYSFADISPDTGNILLTDPYADEQVRLFGTLALP